MEWATPVMAMMALEGIPATEDLKDPSMAVATWVMFPAYNASKDVIPNVQIYRRLYSLYIFDALYLGKKRKLQITLHYPPLLLLLLYLE